MGCFCMLTKQWKSLFRWIIFRNINRLLYKAFYAESTFYLQYWWPLFKVPCFHIRMPLNYMFSYSYKEGRSLFSVCINEAQLSSQNTLILPNRNFKFTVTFYFSQYHQRLLMERVIFKPSSSDLKLNTSPKYTVVLQVYSQYKK
jgi:hypothetical protein